jgi:hypothetical protein
LNIVTALSLIVCGIFAVAGVTARRQRDRRAAVDALAWYQGWVGAPVAAWGGWGLIVSVARLYQLRSNPLWWATFLGTAAFQVVLGSLLVVGLLTLSAYQSAPDRGSAVRQRLGVVEIPLGLIAIGVGFWCFAATFLFHEISG